MDGMRKCFAEEFTRIFVFALRGNLRRNMQMGGGGGGEGENVFKQDTMAGTAIVVLVKKKNADELIANEVNFCDIGKNLCRKEKLRRIKQIGSIGNFKKTSGYKEITPNRHGDWLKQRDLQFERYAKLGDKKEKAHPALFSLYSLGTVTNRDAWCINFSRNDLEDNIKRFVICYNQELARWRKTGKYVARTRNNRVSAVDEFITRDKSRISWTRSLKNDLLREADLSSDDGVIVPCVYRPFTRSWQFFSRRLNECVYRMPTIFPTANSHNRAIAVTGRGSGSKMTALMVDALPDIQVVMNAQCFPLWLYRGSEPRISPGATGSYTQCDAITDYALGKFRNAYPSEKVCREDIFYYIYGLLHLEEYCSRFRANLAKELPRIPCVKPVEDYRAFRDAGERLGDLHLGYEDADPYPATTEVSAQFPADAETAYRVVKMRHPGVGKKMDRSTVIYNSYVTVRDIPEEAWDYVVNGKPAIAWVMSRQSVKTHKASGIVNDANRYAIETVGDPRYPLDLLLRVITVSLETMKIVRGLPELVID